MQRVWRVGAYGLLVLLLAGLALPTGAFAKENKLKGFMVNIPGGSLTLPVMSDTVITVVLGSPLVPINITVTPATMVEREEGAGAVTLTNEDLVEVEFVITGGKAEATKLKLEDFPEVRLFCTIGGLPMGGLALPLSAGASPVDATCTLGTSGITEPITFTTATRVEGSAFVLMNGDNVEIQGRVRDNRIMVTEIENEM